ncbi:MAG: 3-methyl-2-oxobutanoate hydroxymethyltransferase, partial [Bacilli bacterium]
MTAAKHTTATIQAMRLRGEPIVMVTAYDASQAAHAQDAGVDVILVGDSVGMVMLGYDSTIPVTVDDMVHHAKAVRRGAQDTMVLVDMPFASYHQTAADT